VIHEAAFRGRFVEPAVRDAMQRVSGLPDELRELAPPAPD